MVVCANRHESPAWQRFFVYFRDEFGGISLNRPAPRRRSREQQPGAMPISTKTHFCSAFSVRVLYAFR
jgi:hypothetical protein